MERFDLQGPLPDPASTTVLEASAGTGKTFALAGLVTRYVAEGEATLDQMLLITFGRAASQELRDRVRRQITDAAAAFDDPSLAGDNQLVEYLLRGTDEVRAARQQRLRDALAGFDSATIATTHQFCQLVLKSLGVAGDSDSRVTLVESLTDLVTEVVDDLYLSHFGQQRDDPVLSYPDALKLAKEVVGNPATELRPLAPPPDSRAAVCMTFANHVLAELETRKRRLGILGYDDLLTRLAEALDAEDSPARLRMHQRWPIVMVDEFQDTDPVQWQVIDRAFSGRSTVILIGDPKQAIYAFRGGDIVTYLSAAETAGAKKTLGTNWRSDSMLVDSLQVVLRGAELGDPKIVVHDVEAANQGSRLAGAPSDAPFRLRVVQWETFGRKGTQNVSIDAFRQHIAKDLSNDIGALLTCGATFCDEPVQAGDVAIIVETHKDARVCQQALGRAGIPAVYAGDSDIFTSEAADDWLSLLEAFDQPHRAGVVRAAAATMFFGKTAQDLVDGGDALTDGIAETLREWAGHARERGVAAILEAAQLSGMSDRVLSWRDGERHMTDLAHMTQLLQDVAHREQYTLPALRDWLRSERTDRGGASERNRRLDSDAAAVQIMTVWVSKGLQYPVVYLPFAFNRNVREKDLILFHDGPTRCLFIGGKESPDYREVERMGREESAGDDSRLTYVALTRAQAQVVAWWAPSWDEPNGGLSRLLRGRRPGDDIVPDKCVPAKINDDEALVRLREWESLGGPVLEQSVLTPSQPPPAEPVPTNLDARHFHRSIDTTWRRTSYSGLIRVAETAGVSSEPDVVALDDEVGDLPLLQPSTGPHVPSPMADLPKGAKFGTLVHAVLETADPFAADLAAELEAQIREHSVWWPVDVPAADLAAALVPMHDTPLGPLAADLTLRQIGLPDRLRELDFEFPLAGGDLGATAPPIHLRDVGRLVAEHLPADDPLASYAERLTGDALGNQSLRGYLNGSIDAVLRIPDSDGDHRYVVVDYKSNWLGDGDGSLTSADYERARLVEAMLHSDYPLQALLYSVVLHRFLRWRQPDYSPDRHLGGVLYLFVRGMCGADSPVIDGHGSGVFDWQPPASLIVAVSDLLDSGRAACMTSVEPVDTADWRRAVGATGLLAAFNAAAVIDSADVLVAQRLGALAKETDERVLLAVALVVRGLRAGSVCLDLRSVEVQVDEPDLPWPAIDGWLEAVWASPLLDAPHVLRRQEHLLYLDRYWREEQQVADDMRAMVSRRAVEAETDIERLFPAGYEEQRGAARIALSQRVTVLTGGPGTGKTTTVARLLALFAGQAGSGARLRIALAAPTGKAAARLQEAVQLEIDKLDLVDQRRLSGLQATTLHRLLGSRPDTSSRFRHDRGNRLPHDVIVVDETSMVSLTMMARLLEAVRPQSRLLLVGDPDQLASVDAGAVLADLVDGLGAGEGSPVVALQTSHRFGESIGALAAAIRTGDADAALEVLRAGGDHIEWVDDADPTATLRTVLLPQALALRQAAVLGDAGAALQTLDEQRLLCAHRRGPYGVQHWNRQAERWLSESTGEPIWSDWYAGRPVLVTANDYGLGLYNGDTGVTVAGPDGLRAAIAGAGSRARSPRADCPIWRPCSR